MSDIEIARAAKSLPIEEIGSRLGWSPDQLVPYGHDKAKFVASGLASSPSGSGGKLVLVTAISPTPAGEGKTTTTVGLVDGLNRIGKRAAVCIREPSLGPCFGMKGGAAGGGKAQVIPMEDINLHFTGDFHAITSAHNLLSAMLDNHIYWGNSLGIDTRRVSWRRVLDMNDRALRQIVTSLGGVANGHPREAGFDITVASEVMAILCLASGTEDLRRRLGDVIVARRPDLSPVTCRDIGADGAMVTLLHQAIHPNLVQTLENNPALVHGGPFANIAHGCSSVIATRAAMASAEFVVTEAGFGADLGAEKFFNIKCRKSGLTPDAVVLVATVRALKMHGGLERDQLGVEDVPALRRGLANLGRHIENLGKFGIPVAVGINRFTTDTEAEIGAIQDYVQEAHGHATFACSHWADGGAGIEALAEHVAKIADGGPPSLRLTYEDDMPLADKIRAVATEVYRAGDIAIPDRVARQLHDWEAEGHGNLPVCMAKTQYSFSADPSLRGAPDGHTLPVREVRLSAGAGFVVAIAGDIMTMPGLPRRPAAESIGIDSSGRIEGLF